MSLDFSIEDFKSLYCDKLLSTEDMIRHLNITDYTYKKIIKEFNLSRCKTNKINRFKATNGLNINNIDATRATSAVVKIPEIPEIPEKKETKETKETEETKEKSNNDILDKVKETLAKSKKNRTIRKY